MSDDLLDLPVRSLGLPARLYNALTSEHYGNGFKTVREVIRLTEREMLRTPNLGKTSLNALKLALAERGLELAPEVALVPQPPPVLFPAIHERLSRIEARLMTLEATKEGGVNHVQGGKPGTRSEAPWDQL